MESQPFSRSVRKKTNRIHCRIHHERRRSHAPREAPRAARHASVANHSGIPHGPRARVVATIGVLVVTALREPTLGLWLRTDLSAGVEALVLLDALAQLDFGAFEDEMRSINVGRCRAPDRSCLEAPNEVVLGVDYEVYSVDCFKPIAACMHGTKTQPTGAFANDFSWLLKATEASDKFHARPVPVRLQLRWSKELTSVLEDILHHIMLQQNQLNAEAQHGGIAEWTPIKRLEIVEVSLRGPMNIDALPVLVKLQEHGVHVADLPVLSGDDESLYARHMVTQYLRHLLVRQESVLPSPPSIKHVYLSNDIPEHLLYPLLSAVQVSQTVDTIELSVEGDFGDEDFFIGDSDGRDKEELERKEQERRALVQLVRWTAYALFTRHANHAITKLEVQDPFINNCVVEVLQSVVHAQNPLEAVFTNVTENERWVSSTRFYLGLPKDQCGTSNESPIFLTEEPLYVRAVRKTKHAGVYWWRVLLPGCGPAWVRITDATSSAHIAAPTVSPLHFHFDHLCDSNRREALALIRLIRHFVGGVVIDAYNVYSEYFEPGDEATNITPFVREIVRLCPSLEILTLPMHTVLDRICIFSEAAVTWNLQLRELDLDCGLDSDNADIIGFFDVLSDMTHPFTRHLEKLSIQLEAMEDELIVSWERMLQNNRRLHSISVKVSHDYKIARGEEEIVIRTAPLEMASKLAFLSVLKDPHHGTGACCLDASIVGAIFEFAAPHLVRVVRVMWE